jgi:hypothetical protein
MSWFLRHWEHRYQQDIEIDSRALIDETEILSDRALVQTDDGKCNSFTDRT